MSKYLKAKLPKGMWEVVYIALMSVVLIIAVGGTSALFAKPKPKSKTVGSSNTDVTQDGVVTTQGGVVTTQGGVVTTQGGVATTQGGVATTQGGSATTQGGGGSEDTFDDWKVCTGNDDCDEDQICTTKTAFSRELTEDQNKDLVCKKKLNRSDTCSMEGDPLPSDGACYFSYYDPIWSDLCQKNEETDTMECQYNFGPPVWAVIVTVLGLIAVGTAIIKFGSKN